MKMQSRHEPGHFGAPVLCVRPSPPTPRLGGTHAPGVGLNGAVTPEIVTRGIRFGEGPVWCPAGTDPSIDVDTLVVTSVADGALFRVWPEAQHHEVLAVTGGGANGAALATGGTILVTQNGGIDFAPYGIFAEPPPPMRAMAPGLQVVTPDAAVTYLAGGDATSDKYLAPNDLCVAPDGTVYFTDPGHFPPPDDDVGRVIAR